jgi:hypothetical protein
MDELIIKEQFDKSFSKIRDFKIKKQIWTKILEQKTRLQGDLIMFFGFIVIAQYYVGFTEAF